MFNEYLMKTKNKNNNKQQMKEGWTPTQMFLGFSLFWSILNLKLVKFPGLIHFLHRYCLPYIWECSNYYYLVSGPVIGIWNTDLTYGARSKNSKPRIILKKKRRDFCFHSRIFVSLLPRNIRIPNRILIEKTSHKNLTNEYFRVKIYIWFPGPGWCPRREKNHILFWVLRRYGCLGSLYSAHTQASADRSRGHNDSIAYEAIFK